MSCLRAILQNWPKVRVGNVLKKMYFTKKKKSIYANCIISKVHISSNCEAEL